MLPAVDKRDHLVEIDTELRLEVRQGLKFPEDLESDVVFFGIPGPAD
jgi:hypothetical protein